VPRDEQTDKILATAEPSAAQIAEAEAARRAFVQWHLVSLLFNMLTLGLVTVAMALAARLPTDPSADPGVRNPRDGGPSAVPSS